MTVKYSVALRNAKLDAIETKIGVSGVLKIRTGAEPADVAAVATGTVLATLNLPSDYFNAASGGLKTLLGTWEDLTADASGDAGYWRFYESDGVTCHMQGSCGEGSGDLSLDNITLAAGQEFAIPAMTITDGNG